MRISWGKEEKVGKPTHNNKGKEVFKEKNQK
jgi:hypothetical protein